MTQPIEFITDALEYYDNNNDKYEELLKKVTYVELKKHTGEMNNDEKKIVDEEFEKQIAGKTPEEQKKLRELRHQLHAQYYQKLVNPPKQQEERPAEKVEKEKKQEMQELEQKEAKKPAPLAVSMAREKTEKFPGASG